jgi:pSer/pThr/pTyr-binding forkhead associated (FHA) protein
MAKLQIFLPGGSEITHDLPEEKTTIGRLPENTLHIDDSSVSSNHAEIIYESHSFFVHDLGSTNGTFLNGAKVETAVLNHADELRFGSVVCLFTSQGSGNDQALIESASLITTAANESRRPVNFVSSSQLPREATGKDSALLALVASVIVGFLATAAAVYMIIQNQPPA